MQYGRGMTRRLSPAEIESLAALAQADHSRDAARIRGVSEQTIKNELTSAYRKLGVRSRTSAFRSLGWLQPPGHNRVRRLPLRQTG
jgi:DNA-binding CsgD family transcriptional regulator